MRCVATPLNVAAAASMGVLRSGVCAAVDGEVGAGDGGGFGAGEEGDEGGDFVHGAVAFEGGVGDLGGGPIAGGGVEVGVDGAGLDVVDGDAAGTDFAGEALGEHFDGALGGGVGDEAGGEHAFADARADGDDAAAFFYVLERRLGGDEDAAHVDVNHAVHLLEGGF